MRNVIFILLLLLGLVNSILCQITIGASDVAGNGAVLRYENKTPSKFYFPTPNGSNQSWYYTFSEPTNSYDTVMVISPSQAPLLSDFPTANKVLYHPSQDFYNYLEVRNDGLYILGLSTNNFSIKYTKPYVIYPFPLSYGASFKDSTSVINKESVGGGIYSYDSTMSITRFSFDAQATGDGKITLNSQVHPQVVKVKYNITTVTEYWVRDTMVGWVKQSQNTDNFIQYFWISKKFGLTALELKYDSTESNTTEIRLLTGYAPAPSGIFSETQSPFEIYPNPVKDFIYIKNPEGINKIRVEILNPLGQVITQAQFYGNRVSRINLSKLPAGLYMVRIEAKGDIYYHRFIKK